ncbi:CDP-glycerol glycerophosphotransferase family protein [Staphylococcus sp. NAM3COL9]|uniref:CDP-glycerol glycerophosphotransferase family protein n=1 Tax=Staphylococcus sp. NAM3COL9 TaxID=1667172 RepID=UPI00070ACB0A|nr:CDP-glycerol glycerophosphotransferase family protein [Staphylococcus sp. NAM3COL9]
MQGMKVKKYSNLFDFDIQNNFIIYVDPRTTENCTLDIDHIDNTYICDIKVSNRLIASIDNRLLIYVKNNKVFITKCELYKQIFDVEIKNLNKSNIKLEFKKGYIAEIKLGDDLLFELDDFFAHTTDEKIIANKIFKKLNIDFNDRQRYIGLANIKYNNIKIFITYDRFLKEIKFKKTPFNIEYLNKYINVEFINANNLKIENKQNGDDYVININRIGITPTAINGIRASRGLKNEHILAYFSFQNRRYFIYNQSNGVHILRSNAKLMSKYRTMLKVISTRKAFYLIGLFKHNGYKAKHKYDTLYMQNKNNKVGKFYRPFKKIKVLNQLVLGKIAYEDIKETNRIHSNLLCGNENYVLHNVSLNPYSKPMKTFKTTHYENNTMIFRNNLGGNVTLTSIPYSPEYKSSSKLKIYIAKFFKKNKTNQNINLFFEKKSERAEESAIKVFDEAIKSSSNNSKNYFILDGNAPYYKTLKKKYGKNLIKKYSIKHFKSIYNSKYFISSELPNHLINDRLYIDSLRNKIMKTPSVFLQHGIMFAKPVDNPMAYGFHKQYNKYNNIKNVISSDLEAEQFYKMGYDKEDLIKTGLATFDEAKLNEDADKIAYMPTYRYWEERLIYSGDITKTSYFQAIMKVINVFEKNGLLDKLLIVPHNKFSEFIYDNMPEYRDIIEPNPSNALKVSRIFITDYSSAIYDSIYRGAYPIFYWEEKDYLIENYKAIPPINEQNAPGPVAENIDELYYFVKQAIERDCKLEQKYIDKYLKINEFSDGQNTKRIVKELEKIKIL